ncbi:SLAM family member 9-like isoform X2 [Megalobrama amblycephala]|uniref:SLAM family member 9-like isoform X2 n=1 Tax=Megalobrama amblycephala TaxID=75352 RepID=UPI002014098C|nr:SLAM family member 9-like isoform X2 [Megalobrama amblycephala]
MISVMEGDSVTLNTDVTEILRDDLIVWTFRLNSSDTVIAEIYKLIISIYDNKENNERFRDRLQIDEQTGSLTITNINRLHSGHYKVLIKNEDVKQRSFNISVCGILTVPVIIRDTLQNSSSSSGSSRCSLLCSAVNVGHVTLSWYKGNSLLSSISVSDLSISLSLPLEVEYQDKNTYSCVLNNPIRNQTKHLDNISQLCQPNSAESNQTSFIVVSLLLLLLLLFTVVVVLIFCRRRKYTQAKQKAQSNEEEVDYTDATFIKHRAPDTFISLQEADGRDQTVYSEVALR